MANLKSWVNALKVSCFGECSTLQTYSRIKALGLRTVDWISIEFEGSEQLFVEKVNSFIEQNRPCLFIWDPKVSCLKKGYFFNLSGIEKVKDWVLENRKELGNYSYLVTTQVNGFSEGFVGSAYSDGKGMLFCETLHIQGTGNHRELSQPKEDISKFLDFFACENFGLSAISGKFLKPENILEIIRAFSDKKGYFEFTKGLQNGKLVLFTTGFEDSPLFSFPKELFDSSLIDKSLKHKAALFNNFNGVF